MSEETTITIRHIDMKTDNEVQSIADKTKGVSKNFIYMQIVELGLKAYKNGYKVEDDIPVKKGK